MTKEMRPRHRIDVLSDALLHYGKRTRDKIGVYQFIRKNVLISNYSAA